MNTKTQLIIFLVFSLMIYAWHIPVLFGMLMLLLSVLVLHRNTHFFKLMRRLKWFYIVLLLIFIFNTPGEHIAHWPLRVKPTYEGVQMGLEQLLRITVMLAALSVVLMMNTRQQLISAMYFLLRPLTHWGIDVQRFAARLWLTLHYVEAKQEQPRLTQGLAAYLSAGFAVESAEDVLIELENGPYAWVDYIALGIMLIMVLNMLFGWVG